MELKELKRLLDLRDAEDLTEEEQEELKTLEAKASAETEEEEEEERSATDAEIRSLVNKAIEKQTKATKRVAPEVTKPKVTADPADSEHTYVENTLRLFNGLITKRDGVVQEAQTNLAKAGHYGREVQGEIRAAGDYYSSVVDADGAYLLPTKVRDQIERKIGDFGAFAKVSDMWTETEGTIRVNGSTGSLKAYAIAEGAVIKSKKRAFKALELFPKKWGLIVPWTFEIELRQGQKVLDDINAALAMGFAEAQDEAGIKGDGTAAYNSITGLFLRAGVKSQTLATGSTTYNDVSPDDLVNARNQVAPEFRRNLAYIFHPDMEVVFMTRKDNNGQYIFDYTQVNGINILKGLPVYYTQALPGIDTASQAGTNFGLIGNFDLWKIATGGGIFADMLREGTVEDADTGAAFNLATQDGKALRVKQLFDMNTNFEEGFAKFTTAAT